MKSEFPIIDGKKTYQDFMDYRKIASLKGFDRDLEVICFLIDKLNQQVYYLESEKKRVLECITLFKEEKKDALTQNTGKQDG